MLSRRANVCYSHGMKRAKVISFEGRDCVGKATQSRRLVDALTRLHLYRTVHLELPLENTMTGRVIYSMLESGTAKRHPLLFQSAHVANKLGLQLACMPYLLATQDYVIADRWSTSAIVYGRATGVPDWFLRASAGLLMKPDAVVILDGDSHRAVGSGDSYERSVALQERVRSEYLVWAEHNRDVAIVIDASGTPATVHDRVIDALAERGLL